MAAPHHCPVSSPRQTLGAQVVSFVAAGGPGSVIGGHSSSDFSLLLSRFTLRSAPTS